MIRTIAAAAVLAALAAAGCSNESAFGLAAADPFTDAVEACDLAGDPHVVIADNGATLTVDGAGDDDPGVDVEGLACLIVQLEVTTAVVTRMDSTRALDGMQTATWGGFTATWSYHPDNGFDLIVEASR